MTKQTTFYYQIKWSDEEIEIITIFDARKDPDSLNDDLN
ncbi:hypothetical protein JCM19301_3900 [Jejuia pallidilutea]|uniref:Type II toxin-antitoxin system RelE/ParE family toxin n=1 Tax=Jejuia pallidilutea TaxID=504487 RepID=A0A090VL12_9FLAO|nr:hypothetical protein JCM19301_3900 [Jejuia pallidilutea]GAL73279.1 hypothetical protein JCM19302_2545 [Jejuia pallidilutea]GAL89002.1 hypothetical protein JCM19538_1991 [Jejuia pallidilutea]